MPQLLVLLLLTSVGFAAPTISDRSIVFSPRVEQYDERATVWSTEWGSYKKEFSHQRILSLHMRVLGSVNPSFAVIWCFLGRNADGTGLVYLGEGERIVRLQPDNTFLLQVESPDFSGRDSKYAALQVYDRSGIRPFGWAVAIVQEGRIVASTGSTPEAAELGRSHAEDIIQEKVKAAKAKRKNN